MELVCKNRFDVLQYEDSTKLLCDQQVDLADATASRHKPLDGRNEEKTLFTSESISGNKKFNHVSFSEHLTIFQDETDNSSNQLEKQIRNAPSTNIKEIKTAKETRQSSSRELYSIGGSVENNNNVGDNINNNGTVRSSWKKNRMNLKLALCSDPKEMKIVRRSSPCDSSTNVTLNRCSMTTPTGTLLPRIIRQPYCARQWRKPDICTSLGRSITKGARFIRDALGNPVVSYIVGLATSIALVPIERALFPGSCDSAGNNTVLAL
ncbi:uncharacterized protein LOC116603727 [Nematostella vectensis]|uniref:uncharacterized protein LOC116603727 n=1 Tax=Nematostella vectensis TaxID=45351 RepID=UPI002076EEDF|nr:uncharacterized protein LOC116603727 [Nematostella vectensis]